MGAGFTAEAQSSYRRYAATEIRNISRKGAKAQRVKKKTLFRTSRLCVLARRISESEKSSAPEKFAQGKTEVEEIFKQILYTQRPPRLGGAISGLCIAQKPKNP